MHAENKIHRLLLASNLFEIGKNTEKNLIASIEHMQPIDSDGEGHIDWPPLKWGTKWSMQMLPISRNRVTRKEPHGMHAETKIIRLLLAALLSEVDENTEKNMIFYLEQKRPSGSCGDGNFDRAQIALENETIDKAITRIKFPSALITD